MVAVGLVWGATKCAGARCLVPPFPLPPRRPAVLLTWPYSAPFPANLSASASFSRLDAPNCVAVPVTNSTTFAATAVAAALLGKGTRAAPAALIVLSVWVCIS